MTILITAFPATPHTCIVSIDRTGIPFLKPAVITRVFPIPFQEMREGIYKMKKGVLVQNVFPQLDDDFREMLISGYTPEEWDELFGEEDD